MNKVISWLQGIFQDNIEPPEEFVVVPHRVVMEAIYQLEVMSNAIDSANVAYELEKYVVDIHRP